jgi:pseudaminic acid synthase
MKIDSRTVDNFKQPFIIAELSGNHCGSMEEAKRMINKAKDCGADAVKLQSFKPDTITFNSSNSYFLLDGGVTMYDVYEKFATPYEWYPEIFALCQKIGIICFSSPFDENAVDVLEKFDNPVYKIASFELGHFPLVERIIKTGKPIIASIGMAHFEEIEAFINLIKEYNYIDKVALLKCTSVYPAPFEELNLSVIRELMEKYNIPIGFSDHSTGVEAAVGAVAMGSAIIEKHFTLDRSNGGADSFMSLEPAELSALVVACKNVHKAIGSVQWGPTKSEMQSLKFKRSIFVVKNIKKGEVFTTDHLRIIRPGDGIHPKFLNSILGKIASDDIEAGTPLLLKMIDEF